MTHDVNERFDIYMKSFQKLYDILLHLVRLVDQIRFGEGDGFIKVCHRLTSLMVGLYCETALCAMLYGEN